MVLSYTTVTSMNAGGLFLYHLVHRLMFFQRWMCIAQIYCRYSAALPQAYITVRHTCKLQYNYDSAA